MQTNVTHLTQHGSPQASTQDPQAQSLLNLSQAAHLQTESLKLHWDANDRLRKQLAADFESLKSREAELLKREQAASDKWDEATKKSEESNKWWEEADKERQVAEKARQEQKQLLEATNAKEQALQALISQADDVTKKRAEAAEQVKVAAELYDQISSERAIAVKAKEEAASAKVEAAEIQKNFWPASLSATQLERLRGQILAAATQPGGGSMLMASIYSLYAAEKAGDVAAIIRAIEVIGRQLYQNRSTEDAAMIADALNEASANRYLIKYAHPKDIPNEKWMNYPNGIAAIKTVKSWAVFEITAGNTQNLKSSAEVG